MTDMERRRILREEEMKRSAREAAKRRKRFSFMSIFLLLVAVVVYLRFNFNLVSLTPKAEVYPAGTQKIVATWHNKTLSTIYYGDEFVLQRLDGAEFKAIDSREELVIIPFYGLKSQTKALYEYDLQKYGALIPGVYRIYTGFSSPNGDGNAIYCTFEIK